MPFFQCLYNVIWNLGFPGSSTGIESACNIGDPGSIPGSGRSTGEGTGYPLQYSGLENSMDHIVRGVAKSWTQLSHFHHHPTFFPYDLCYYLILFNSLVCFLVSFQTKCKPLKGRVRNFISVIYSCVWMPTTLLAHNRY